MTRLPECRSPIVVAGDCEDLHFYQDLQANGAPFDVSLMQYLQELLLIGYSGTKRTVAVKRAEPAPIVKHPFLGGVGHSTCRKDQELYSTNNDRLDT